MAATSVCKMEMLPSDWSKQMGSYELVFMDAKPLTPHEQRVQINDLAHQIVNLMDGVEMHTMQLACLAVVARNLVKAEKIVPDFSFKAHLKCAQKKLGLIAKDFRVEPPHSIPH
jgi:hypothetical protein